MRKSLSHLFFKKLDGRELELQISLTSGSVSAALVYMSPDEVPRILVSDYQEIEVPEDPDQEQLRMLVLRELDNLLAAFTKELGSMYEITELFNDHQIIHSVAVSLTSLWTTSEVVTYKKDFDVSTVITKQDIVPDQLKEGEGVIDIRVLDTQANGYRVDPASVVGIETTHLESQIKRTELDPLIQKDISDTITKHIMADVQEDIVFVPMTTIALQTLQELYGVTGQFSFLFFDNEEMTMITRDADYFLSLTYKNYGRAEILRQLTQEQHIPGLAYARDMVDMFFSNMLEEDHAKTVADYLEIESRLLAKLVVEEGSQVITPLYVLTDGMGEPFVKKYLTTHLNILSLTHISLDDFLDHVSYDKGHNHPSTESHLFALFRGLQRAA